jgi:hypothetical protein
MMGAGRSAALAVIAVAATAKTESIILHDTAKPPLIRKS